MPVAHDSMPRCLGKPNLKFFKKRNKRITGAGPAPWVPLCCFGPHLPAPKQRQSGLKRVPAEITLRFERPKINYGSISIAGTLGHGRLGMDASFLSPRFDRKTHCVYTGMPIDQLAIIFTCFAHFHMASRPRPTKGTTGIPMD